MVDKENCYSTTLPGLKKVDCGNFLSFAVIEGIVNSIVWTHDEYGGRNNDTTYVKYTTDLTALPYRIRNWIQHTKTYPLEYSEHLFKKGNNFYISEKMHLDIDWDFFFLKGKPDKERKRSIELFLETDLNEVPHYTYVSYSSDYVVPSRREFEGFIAQLASKFGAETISYSHPLPQKGKVNTVMRYGKELKSLLREYLIFPLKKKLNKVGIY
jgi:hypothetical protein